MCNCVSNINNLLKVDYKDDRACIDCLIVFGANNHEYPRINVEYRPIKKDGSYGKSKMVSIRPTFCPFCGVKYESIM